MQRILVKNKSKRFFKFLVVKIFFNIFASSISIFQIIESSAKSPRKIQHGVKLSKSVVSYSNTFSTILSQMLSKMNFRKLSLSFFQPIIPIRPVFLKKRQNPREKMARENSSKSIFWFKTCFDHFE